MKNKNNKKEKDDDSVISIGFLASAILAVLAGFIVSVVLPVDALAVFILAVSAVLVILAGLVALKKLLE